MKNDKPGWIEILVGALAVGSVAVILLILMLVPTAILDGWVLTHLWEWFIVPTFGLKPLSLVAAMGVSLIASFLTHHYHESPKTDESNSYRIGKQFFSSITYALVALAIGYVIHLFM